MLQLYRRWSSMVTLSVMLLLSAAACRPISPAPAAQPATATPAPGMLHVDASHSLGRISPYVYGTNYGPWMGVPLDMQEPVRAAGLTFLRFPGGAYGDENALQPYQIDQFVTFARELGAEPGISVRLRNGTPGAAAELVRYANVERQYGIRYWSIGNEPTLYASAHSMDYDPERFNQEWRAIADAMEAVDPDILLIGPDLHQFTGDPHSEPRDKAGTSMTEWMRLFLEANGDRVDVVSFHRYPFPSNPANPPPSLEELRPNSEEWDRIIPNLRALIRETLGRDLPVAVTEINSNWSHALGGEATPDSPHNAIWWADVLGRLIRQDVEIVAHFALVAPRGSGWGMVTRQGVRPLYYVYRMYQEFGGERVHGTSGVEGLSLFASRREDGALALMIVNLEAMAHEVPLRVDGFAPSGPAEVWRLDAEHLAERVETVALRSGDQIVLPPHSVTLYVLPGSSP